MKKLILSCVFVASSALMALCGADVPKAHLCYQMDISRCKVPTMKTVKSVVDLLAKLGYDQFQLYSEQTFAYKDHKRVWEEWSAFTAEEIRELTAYCAKKGIDLIPNQNSFGHLERWLVHPEYNHLAEAPKAGIRTHWNTITKEPMALCPTDSRSLPFIASLYDELLPNFQSKYFNVGCDEVVDMDDFTSRSGALAKEKGIASVYVDFLLKIHKEVTKRGKTMMFWADIVHRHPELIPQLPKNMVALNWGYEAKHPFEKECAEMKASGIPFYVCPGASSWLTICGRTDNMMACIDNAVAAGKKHGAMGLMMADWGDHGHCQPFLVSLPAIVYAAAKWRGEKMGDQADLARAIDKLVGAQVGECLLRWGNLYRLCGRERGNSSELFYMLANGAKYQRPAAVTDANLAKVFQEVKAARAQRVLSGAPEWVRDDMDLLDLLLDALEMRAQGKHAEVHAICPPKYRALWLKYNRPGGLERSIELVFGTGIDTPPNPTRARISRTLERMQRSTLENPETVRVLFYGQSIVQQNWGPLYVIPVLQKKYPTVKFVVENRAIGGYTTPALIKTAEADLYPFYPDLLFFHDYGDTKLYTEIVRRARERTTADIVLWTSHLNLAEGQTLEKTAALLAKPDARSIAIRETADQFNCMYIDLRTKWCRMLLASGRESYAMLNDTIHMKSTSLATYAEMIAEDILAEGALSPNPAAGQVTTSPAALSFTFTGNRVVATANGETGAEYDVFLDGKPVGECRTAWTMTRTSKGPSKRSWNPVLDRVDFGGGVPVAEKWTLTFLPGASKDGKHIPFKLTGSVTGEDGEGNKDKSFVSKSGRVAIQPDGWADNFWWGYHKTEPQPGYQVTWETKPLFTSPAKPGTKGEDIVLVQGCANGPHTLELKPRKPGPLGFATFTVYAPAKR
ncbi:MAG: family 20 glycosylhydrolase [Kiritimatiellae bacterium]|nr:family 20 glycosylhydrolase [Kiritimatiellia bacterium]